MRRKKKIPINKDAGNVELNIQSFNNGFAENINSSLDAISELNRLDEEDLTEKQEKVLE